MKLTVIGCSGSFAGPDSPASSYLVEQSDEDGRIWRVLLDCGNGALGSLQQVMDPSDLDAVLITHLHGDHFLDMCGLEVYRKYHPERPCDGPLPVHAPVGAGQRLNRISGNDTDAAPDDSPFTFRVWSEAEAVTIGPLTVTPHRVLHPVEAYALRLEGRSATGEPRVLAYSGDTDACDGLVTAARNADLLLCEAGYVEGRDDGIDGVHLTGSRAGQCAAAAAAKSLILTHIPAWTDPRIPHAEAKETFTGPIEVAVRHAEYTL